MLNLAMLLEQSARRDPSKIALIFDDIKLRYAELNGAANKVANGLVKLGVKPGDEDGYYFIKDGGRNLIIRGRVNIYARRIEELLYAHPAIAEAAVIGVHDQALGEGVKAVVAFKPGQSTTESEIIAYCKERLAAYKYPRLVEICDTLPKTATGKILKRELN